MINFLTNEQESYKSWNLPNINIIHSSETAIVDGIVHNIRQNSSIGLDIETNGLDPLIHECLLLGIGNADDVLIIDTTTVNPKAIMDSISDLLVLGHSLKFDWSFLHYIYGVDFKNFYDVKLAEQRLCLNYYPMGKGYYDLAAISRRYLGIEMTKDTRMEFTKMKGRYLSLALKPKHLLYLAEDLKYLHRIKSHQDKRTEKQHIEKIHSIEMKLCRNLAKMELKGMAMDIPKLDHRTEVNRARMWEVESRLYDIFWELRENSPYREMLIGRRFDRKPVHTNVIQEDLFGLPVAPKKQIETGINWGSPVQMIELFGKLGLECPTEDGDAAVPKITEQGRLANSHYLFTTTEKELQQYLIKNPKAPHSKLITELLLYREYSTRVSRYGFKLKEKMYPTTNKLHTLYRQVDAVNGRLQSGGGKEGLKRRINIQNQERDAEFRSIFVADEGKLFLTTDYSGAEVTIICAKAKDVYLRELIQSGDIHSTIATTAWRNIFAYEGDTDKAANFVVNKHTNANLRQDGKNVHFGIFYQASANTIARTINISTIRAMIYILTMKQMFPNVFDMIEYNMNFALSNGYLELEGVTKSKIWFAPIIDAQRANKHPDLSYEDIEDISGQAANIPISGTQANFFKEALNNVQDYLDNFGCSVIMPIHDELVVEVLEDSAVVMQKEVENIMKITANKYLEGFIEIEVESHLAKHWQK